MFLSSKKSKVLGLILPMISLMYSLIIIFSITTGAQLIDGEAFGMIASTFLLANIPTIIFIVVYIVCREKTKKNKDLEKMNIQDLQ